MLLVTFFVTLLAWTGCGGHASSLGLSGPTGSQSLGSNLQAPLNSGTSVPVSQPPAPPAPPPPPPPPPPQNQNGASLPPGVPPGANVASAIQTLNNWQWCTAQLNGKPCASGLGNATSTITQNQSTPSLSGSSSLFTLGGPTQYSNALWWRSLGPNQTPTHFVYDVYFYINDAASPEALEFDVNQSWNGTRYTWGSECSYRNTGYWDIWNPETEHWETTSVPCPQVSSNAWHHLTWQIERVNGQVHYISVTVDGNVGTVDRYYNPQQGWQGADVNVAFQLDGDYRQDAYSVWLDNVSLSSW